MNKTRCHHLTLTGLCLLRVFFYLPTATPDLSVDAITINGAAICENIPFLNFKTLRVDIYDESTLKTSTKLDEYGRFFKRYRAKKGKHIVTLFNETRSKAIDQAEFYSDQNNKEFNINLNACK